MKKDRASPFYMGQRVKYVRQEVSGSQHCYACGHEVDEYDDVVTEHTVVGIHTSYLPSGGVIYYYELDGDQTGHQISEGNILP